VTIQTRYEIGEFVEGVIDPPGSPGLIVAFMVRGTNHSYQIQWDMMKDASWHLDFELRPCSEKLPICIPVRQDGRGGANS
jgi:hypothetical protein